MNKAQNSNQAIKQHRVAGVGKLIFETIERAFDALVRIWRRKSYLQQTDYRLFYLTSDITQARLVIFLLSAVIAGFGISDYMFFGLSPVFYGLVLLRVGLVAYCGYQFMHVKRVKNYRSYDRSMLAYSLIVVFGILLVNFTRPENFVPHVIVIDMAVIVFYLVLPTRFIFQAIPSLVFSMGEVMIIAAVFPKFMEPALVTALTSLAFANIVAAAVSLQLHWYRWQVYHNLIQRQETDRLAAIGQTAGMIGHDIRNPLQAIVSELYIARQAMADSTHLDDRAAALESIDLIEEQTDYISKIVSDLQDYARPIKPEYKQVDLGKLVVNIFQTVRVPDKITLKIDVKGFPEIRTDSTLIRRALTNLVNNAIQAMPNGGELQLTAVKTEDKVIITVTDTGGGIPQEIRPKLFTPLMTTKAKGQGLGLVVVKRLVEALDGTVTFETETGKGTTFIITLPLKKVSRSS